MLQPKTADPCGSSKDEEETAIPSAEKVSAEEEDPLQKRALLRKGFLYEVQSEQCLLKARRFGSHIFHVFMHTAIALWIGNSVIW